MKKKHRIAFVSSKFEQLAGAAKMRKTKIEENWIDSGLNLTQHFPAIFNIYCLLFMRLDRSFCLLFSWQRYFYLQLKAMRNSIPILRFVPVISLEAFGRKGDKDGHSRPVTHCKTRSMARNNKWNWSAGKSRQKKALICCVCASIFPSLYLSVCVSV